MACGQSHTVVFTRKGTCYAWGHVADGRLGVGTNKRLGIKEPENRYFPTPTLLSSIKTEVVTQVGFNQNNKSCPYLGLMCIPFLCQHTPFMCVGDDWSGVLWAQ